MLGVGVVCFVMAMSNGFKTEIRSRLLGTMSHISVFPLRDKLIEDYYQLTKKIESVEGVVAASPFILTKAAISSASQGDGIAIRGIDLELERLTSTIADDIKAGEYSFSPLIREDDIIPGIILGSGLAANLGVSIGETVVLYSLSGEMLTRNTRPRVARFAVSGIFESGMYEFDGNLAYISLEKAQKLFRMGNSVTTIHLRLNDIEMAKTIYPAIDERLNYQYDVVPWYILHRQIFSYIEFEKLLLALGFVLIIIVAAFSIISTLVMTTMQKRPEIAILKTMGATPASIWTIFTYKGLLIGLVGVLGGWALALAAAFIQNQYQLVTLPPDIYFISYLPIETKLFDFLGAGLVTMLICFLASCYPALVAARFSVVDILRR